MKGYTCFVGGGSPFALGDVEGLLTFYVILQRLCVLCCFIVVLRNVTLAFPPSVMGMKMKHLYAVSVGKLKSFISWPTTASLVYHLILSVEASLKLFQIKLSAGVNFGIAAAPVLLLFVKMGMCSQLFLSSLGSTWNSWPLHFFILKLSSLSLGLLILYISF